VAGEAVSSNIIVAQSAEEEREKERGKEKSKRN
jgi:hypothetical protein